MRLFENAVYLPLRAPGASGHSSRPCESSMGALPQDHSCGSFGKPPAKSLDSVQRIILIEECPCIRLGRVPSIGSYPVPCVVRRVQPAQEAPCEAFDRI